MRNARAKLPLRAHIALTAIDSKNPLEGFYTSRQVRIRVLSSLPMNDVLLTIAAVVVQAALFGFAFLPVIDDTAAPAATMRVLRSPAVFCIALALMLLSGRWPWLTVASELNPDESFFLAQAWRYTQDIIPWRATHGYTSGPLTSWLLAALWQCGTPLSYQTAHVTAALLQILMLCLTYATIRMLAGDVPGRLATMPVALLLARTGDQNFFHLASEHVPLVLLAGAACAAATAASRPETAVGSLFLAGMLAGAVAFAKLQAVPLALALTLWIAVGIWRTTPSGRRRLHAGAALVAGGVVVPLLVMGLVLAGGVADEFWRLYIEANLAYGDRTANRALLVARAARLIADSPMIATLCGMTAALAGLAAARCLAGWRNGRNGKAWPSLASTAALVAVAVFAVGKTGYPFRHYLLLLTLPCMLLAGASLAELLSPGDGCSGTWPAAFWRRSAVWTVLAFTAIVAVPAAVAIRCLAAGDVFLEGNQSKEYLAFLLSRPPSAESRVISRMTLPRDEIAVWGWRPDIYIESGRRPAVRDVDSAGCIIPGPFRESARRKFLENMQRNEPRLFVDAVCRAGQVVVISMVFGPELVDKRLGGHETFPELRDYVARHYVGREQVLYDDSSIRIYERRDAVLR